MRGNTQRDRHMRRATICVALLAAIACAAWSDTAPAATQAQGSAPAPYVLHTGDRLTITVLGHDDLHASLTILPDGSITFPIAGKIQAAGMTSEQLEAALDNGLKSQCNQPDATVTVDQASMPTVSILGGVHTPGVHQLIPGERILGLIADSGGIDGDLTLIDGTLVTDKSTKSIPLNIAAIMAGSDESVNIELKPNDVVLLTQRQPVTYQVQVVGEVIKPGVYTVPATGESFLTALTAAGGPASDASLDHAQLLHDGQTSTVDIRSLEENLSAPATTMALMPNDVLMIPKNDDKVAVLGDVHSPSTYPIPDGKTLSVSEAVALAGGPMQDAISDRAVLLRTTGNGTITQIPVDIDPLATPQTIAKMKGNDPRPQLASATIMKPGDILYVQEKKPKNPGAMNLINPLTSIAFLARSLLFF